MQQLQIVLRQQMLTLIRLMKLFMQANLIRCLSLRERCWLVDGNVSVKEGLSFPAMGIQERMDCFPRSVRWQRWG